MDGKGKYTYANGDVYEGDWKNDVREGKGVFTCSKDGPSAGHVYDGEWKNGKQHGIAVYTYPSGKKEIEEWEDGKMKRVITVLQEPTKVSILFIYLSFFFFFYLFF
jgi:hypothetical protein